MPVFLIHWSLWILFIHVFFPQQYHDHFICYILVWKQHFPTKTLSVQPITPGHAHHMIYVHVEWISVPEQTETAWIIARLLQMYHCQMQNVTAQQQLAKTTGWATPVINYPCRVQPEQIREGYITSEETQSTSCLRASRSSSANISFVNVFSNETVVVWMQPTSSERAVLPFWEAGGQRSQVLGEGEVSRWWRREWSQINATKNTLRQKERRRRRRVMVDS